MALAAGLAFDHWSDIPEQSRPDEPVGDLTALPGGQGTRNSSRGAPDGTRWCRTCFVTLPPTGQETFCPACARQRGTLRRRELRRAAENTVIRVPQVSVEQLVRHTRALESGIAQVLAAVETGQPTEQAGRRLAKASKYISALVSSEFEPRLPPRPPRTPGRAVE